MIVTDHIGHKIKLDKPSTRIVSLVPSLTELLHDLGLYDQVVGRTKFCIYPKNGFPKSKIIGGTKNVHTDIVLDLKPDLVIANKEENVKEQVEILQQSVNTFTTNIQTISDALQMIQQIGEIVGRESESIELVKKIKNLHREKSLNTFTVCYLIWQKPYMTVGNDTYINNFLKEFGFLNCLPEATRYPEITLKKLVELKPDFIFLSSEPFPFNISHAENIQNMTGIPTYLIDGSYCSWYGSRLLPAINYMKTFRQQILR